jgi:hypothetical protein
VGRLARAAGPGPYPKGRAPRAAAISPDSPCRAAARAPTPPVRARAFGTFFGRARPAAPQARGGRRRRRPAKRDPTAGYPAVQMRPNHRLCTFWPPRPGPPPPNPTHPLTPWRVALSAILAHLPNVFGARSAGGLVARAAAAAAASPAPPPPPRRPPPRLRRTPKRRAGLAAHLPRILKRRPDGSPPPTASAPRPPDFASPRAPRRRCCGGPRPTRPVADGLRCCCLMWCRTCAPWPRAPRARGPGAWGCGTAASCAPPLGPPCAPP